MFELMQRKTANLKKNVPKLWYKQQRTMFDVNQRLSCKINIGRKIVVPLAIVLRNLTDQKKYFYLEPLGKLFSHFVQPYNWKKLPIHVRRELVKNAVTTRETV